MKLLGLLALLSLLLMINSNHIVDGDYYIISVKYGTYVDACGSDTICPADPDNLYVNNFFGDHYQHFTVTRLKNGYYTLANHVNDNYITAKDSNNKSKTLSLQDPRKYDKDQQFQILPKGYNSYVIIPRRLDKKAVEAPKYELEELFLGKKDDYNKAQRFYFKPKESYSPAPQAAKMASVASRGTR